MDKVILIVDSDKDYTDTVKARLEDIMLGSRIITENDGESALTAMRTEKPSILVTDLILPKLDGFTLLKNSDRETKVIVCCALNRCEIISKAMNSGADYYMLKPISADNLCDRIGELITDSTLIPEADATGEKITGMLTLAGIPANLKGYQYLKEAIRKAMINPDIINNLTKQLYPDIAVRFCTTASKVERSMRHAIGIAWSRGRLLNINKRFEADIITPYEKPSTGEFIALIADNLLYETSLK